MNSFKLKIEINSSIRTPLYADTIWGHICWGIYYNDGENELNKFLEEYKNEPPLIISDAFRENTLPKPILSIKYNTNNISISDIKKFKTLKKISSLPEEIFYKEDFKFIEENLYNIIEKNNNINNIINSSYQHTTINRITGASLEGGLYSAIDIWFEKGNNIFDIYILSTYDIKKVEKLFNNAFQFGFGADKSIGKGNIAIKEISEKELNYNGSRSMVLSNFIPNDNDNFENFRYDLFTKHGKLGGHFASTINPFKKPLLMYKTGSTFDKIEKKYVGCLLDNIHNDPKIRHYAYAPIINFSE